MQSVRLHQHHSPRRSSRMRLKIAKKVRLVEVLPKILKMLDIAGESHYRSFNNDLTEINSSSIASVKFAFYTLAGNNTPLTSGLIWAFPHLTNQISRLSLASRAFAGTWRVSSAKRRQHSLSTLILPLCLSN